MQPRKRERQTDQTPLARDRRFPAQRELAKSQYLFDDPNHWLNRAFAQTVDRLADRCLELIRHLLARTRVVAGWRGQESKALVPTRLMRITPGGNLRVNGASLTGRNSRFAKVAIVQRARRGSPNLGWNRVQGRFDFSLIGGMIGQRLAHDQQALLIVGHLGVLVLLEALGAAVLHDRRR